MLKREVAVAAPASCLPDGGWSSLTWQSVEGVFEAILAHPFLKGLADGTLPEESFRYYIGQDLLYLREYSRALALVASKAPRHDWVAFFSGCAHETYDAEKEFHSEFLAYFSSTVEKETAGLERSPNSLMYTTFLLSTIHERAFYEGLAAVLPCFVVYAEVGKALKLRGSQHPLYRKWIEKFGGPEFEAIVAKVVRMADEVAVHAGEAARARMHAVFLQSCKLEYLFWDGAYHRQAWPV